jgi:hypothetical protein
MLLLAALSSCVLEPSYSIYPPFRDTEPGEVGNWSLRGSAIPMRHVIRLTPARPNMTGAVCSFVPTNFRDWNLTVRLSAFGGLGGIGFRIIFSSRLCRRSSDGFTLWISTRPQDEHYVYSPVHLTAGNSSKHPDSQICLVTVRSDDSFLDFFITRRGDRIGIQYNFESLDEYSGGPLDCGTETIKKLPDYGYFTVVAETGRTHTDDHDLLKIELDSLSPRVKHRVNYSKVNRRPRQRRPRATFSNMTALPDAFALIREMVARANVTISQRALQGFLTGMIADKIGRAAHLIDNATASFATIAGQLAEAADELPRQVVGFTQELRRQFRTARSEMRAQVETVRALDKSRAFKDARKQTMQAIRNRSIANLLLAISMTELVAFLALCGVRLRRARAVRKVE